MKYFKMTGDVMTRREAREIIFSLIYEADFQVGIPFFNVYNTAIEERSFEENNYVRQVFFGIEQTLPEIDALITEHAVGWKMDRLAKVSRAIMRLAIYEMLYCEDVPASVAINEALELAKIYDHEKAPAFINGVLNAAARAKGLLS